MLLKLKIHAETSKTKIAGDQPSPGISDIKNDVMTSKILLHNTAKGLITLNPGICEKYYDCQCQATDKNPVNPQSNEAFQIIFAVKF